ncbi:polysaccharide deacetylase family protein [Bordetella bronchiseptica]|uniref:polysaccharide deacetylase family protein n=1 Tax=Bordetella bronchiseptica TaxID=518 RepID=UPI0002F6AD2F|nr:polysaccharide deacetylase family protein [Bordetella bronchiseptica]KAK79951.1 polysaccharide deacetylase [Bordetella bronchiseptica CA90 BB02]KDC26471.1 polysaccharide deacetylase [Bordetella bronchiseptica F4563]
MRRRASLLGGLAAALGAVAASAAPAAGAPAAACDKPVYLTFDTGHMGVADLVAEVLARHGVRVTFFLANERTLDGGGSLDGQWAAWWRARAAEGHAFASHTYDHAYWQRDLPDGGFRVRPSAGPRAGVSQDWSAAQYCAALRQPAQRLREMAGAAMLPLFRAPGGKTSPALLQAARACGYAHVGWTPAGFLGDELPSDKYPNAALLRQALQNIRPGDILLAHLGIWSRKDPWAPAVLEPLITGLQAKGFCFATLDTHPAYRPWIASHR